MGDVGVVDANGSVGQHHEVSAVSEEAEVIDVRSSVIDAGSLSGSVRRCVHGRVGKRIIVLQQTHVLVIGDVVHGMALDAEDVPGVGSQRVPVGSGLAPSVRDAEGGPAVVQVPLVGDPADLAGDHTAAVEVPAVADGAGVL